MENVSEILPANTAVVVKAEPGTYSFVETEDVAKITNNLLKGTIKKTFINAEDDTEYYVLSIVDGEVGMYRAKLSNNRFINNANKAYLPLSNNALGIYDDKYVDTSAGEQLTKGFRFDFNNTSAIDNTINKEEVIKTIYDLQGRKVDIPTRGIYIINGKKVLVR
jgi:hypothetical protein